MQTWEFDAVDENGAKIRGRLRALDEIDALHAVRQRRLVPLKVKVVVIEKSLFNRVTSGELEQLTTEIALLLRNGVQLDRALDMMTSTNPNPVLAALLSNMTEDVRSGSSLYKAFARYPQFFDDLYCEMVRIGEETGKLSDVLQKVASNLKFQNELKSKVTQAMVYPAFILAVCFVAILAIFNFIVPSMSGLFANMRDLPSYTVFLIETSHWMQQYQGYLLGALAGLAAYIMSQRSKPGFKKVFFSVLRRLPVLKNGMMLNERIRYVSAMHLMLSSGLPLAQALKLAIGMLNDPRFQSQMFRVKEDVSQGRMLSEALSLTELIEPVALSLIRVGEESGCLDVIFYEISERSRWRFEQWALKLTSMLEPLLIIVMGAMVGSVVVTMLLSVVATTDVKF
jgi:general secretion pathway protein F